MLGTPARWLPKEGKTPSASQAELLDLIKECDIVMPWFVGWYNGKVYLNMQPIIAEHLDWCNKNGLIMHHWFSRFFLEKYVRS